MVMLLYLCRKEAGSSLIPGRVFKIMPPVFFCGVCVGGGLSNGIYGVFRELTKVKQNSNLTESGGTVVSPRTSDSGCPGSILARGRPP